MAKMFPRPPGGPMPSPKGDSKALRNSDAPTSPGYSISKSLSDRNESDLQRGYCKQGRLNADSDPPGWA